MVAQPTIIQQVLSVQQADDKVIPFILRILEGEVFDGWIYDSDHELRFHDHLFVPSSIRDLVMWEFQHSRLTVHPRGNKMYHS